MRLLKFILLVILLGLCSTDQLKKVKKIQNYKKITKAKCSSSGKTCLNLYCSLYLASRYDSLLSFGCKSLSRTVRKPMFNAANWLINIAGNHRQLINIKNVDACPVLDNIDKFPMFKAEMDYFKVTFSGMIHKCPFPEFRVDNASLKLNSNDSGIKWEMYPNGRMKTTFKITDEFDDNIFTVSFWSEQSIHFADPEF